MNAGRQNARLMDGLTIWHENSCHTYAFTHNEGKPA